MKVTTDQARATVRRVARITDGPVVHPSGYKRDFRVETVVIDYAWKGGRFVIEGTFSIHLSGPWLKKDGSNAKDSAGRMRPQYESWSSDDFAPQYAFLAPIIDLLRPNGDLSMTTLNELEID